ncbi:hypothetical protein EI94DRAFT_1785476 [Lactarius quietus]|nr:hypothetical protein EI94DRAFT_1785476 [Lactarius quietus]
MRARRVIWWEFDRPRGEEAGCGGSDGGSSSWEAWKYELRDDAEDGPQHEQLSSIVRFERPDRHRSISGVTSDACESCRIESSDDREVGERMGFEDNRLPRDTSEGFPSLASQAVTTSMAVTIKNLSKSQGRPLYHLGLLEPSRRKRAPELIVRGIRCEAGTITATGIGMLGHYRERDPQTSTDFLSPLRFLTPLTGPSQLLCRTKPKDWRHAKKISFFRLLELTLESAGILPLRPMRRRPSALASICDTLVATYSHLSRESLRFWECTVNRRSDSSAKQPGGDSALGECPSAIAIVSFHTTTPAPASAIEPSPPPPQLMHLPNVSPRGAARAAVVEYGEAKSAAVSLLASFTDPQHFLTQAGISSCTAQYAACAF